MFILTAAGLGLEFAVVKTIAAVGMGILAGGAALVLTQAGFLANALKPVATPRCCASGTTQSTPPPVWAIRNGAARRRDFTVAAAGNFIFLGRWLLFAFMLESLMVAHVPDTLVATWPGSGNALAMPLALLIGVPAYLNGYAAIPLIRSLIDLGMSPATGLAFMLAGSVTSIPAAIAIHSLARPRLFGLYLAMAGVGALAAGSSWQIFL